MNDGHKKFYSVYTKASTSNHVEKMTKAFHSKRDIKDRFQLSKKELGATLDSENLRKAVMLPEGKDLNEWVACHINYFYNQVNMLYGTVAEVCTEQSCPVMNAGPKFEYLWHDGVTVKKPLKLPAPSYRKIIINCLININLKFS